MRITGVIRKLVSRPVPLIGLVIVGAFYGWSLVEGLLQLVGSLTHNPSLGWLMLQSNPFTP